MRSDVLPFDVPEDLPYEWLYREDVTAPHAFVCDVTVTPAAWDSYTKVHQCTAPAKWRMLATAETDDGLWVSGNPPPTPFTIGEKRNVCGTHRQLLERRRWQCVEVLPHGG